MWYFWILYETLLSRAGHAVPHTVQVGPLSAAAPFFGVFAGYAGALLSGVFDEVWHEIFGIDSTLWSPPHLCIMASTLFVDLNLMIGLSTIARRLGAKLEWRSPLLWGLALTGAYTFEAVNFQMSQAFVEAYKAGGVGLMGILYPVLVGAMFPFPLLLNVRLAGRFGVALLLFAVAIVLQYVGTGIAAAGFAILRPESAIEEFVRLNPGSSIAQARDLISSMGFTGLIGFAQAWMMWLSFLPLVLVSLLDRVPWARQRPLVAAPVFSATLVVIGAVWFRQMPVLSDYPVSWLDVALGVVISTTIGLVLGSLGLRLARFATDRWA